MSSHGTHSSFCVSLSPSLSIGDKSHSPLLAHLPSLVSACQPRQLELLTEPAEAGPGPRYGPASTVRSAQLGSIWAVWVGGSRDWGGGETREIHWLHATLLLTSQLHSIYTAQSPVQPTVVMRLNVRHMTTRQSKHTTSQLFS